MVQITNSSAISGVNGVFDNVDTTSDESLSIND